jgi:hypothetical protein
VLFMKLVDKDYAAELEKEEEDFDITEEEV